mmetsp:Transcript_44759/g.37656  ORF Transcript_44759/g.37656 Transcript_44759/m.37656 type:complete len:142 (-) Transcript_44759:188-613(-)
MQQISLNEDQREQFGALQAQFQGHRKQLTSVAAQMSLAERDKKRHSLTLGELEKLPEGTPTYQSCGKMFVMSPCSDIIGGLNGLNDKCDHAIKTLGGQKAALENAIDAQEQKIKDFLQACGGSGEETPALESVKEDEEETP